MQNKTSVLNTALVRVGARMGNAGFQDTPAMQVAGAVYDKCRTLCLSLYPWSFALRRQRLALSAEAAQGPWPFAFALPSDSCAWWGRHVLTHSRHDRALTSVLRSWGTGWRPMRTGCC